MEALKATELASVGPSVAHSDCSVYSEDVEMPERGPSTAAVQGGHAAAPNDSTGNCSIPPQAPPDSSSNAASAGHSSTHGHSRASGPHRSMMRCDTQSAATGKPLYMRLPCFAALAVRATLSLCVFVPLR